MKKFTSMSFSVENTIEKTEEGKNIFKTKQCVRRGRHGRLTFVGHFVFPSFPAQRAASYVVFQAGPAAFTTNSQISGKES
jgi:hypothetical protein